MSDFFQKLSDHLNYTSARNELIARNIANFNTPKYRSLDLENSGKLCNGFLYFSQMLTNEKHMKFQNGSSSHSIIRNKDGIEKWNGNNVDFDSESIKFAKNNLEYEQALTIFNKMLSLLKMAASGGKI